MHFRRGITPDEKFIETRHKGFFLPEAAVATMFRSIILCSLKEYYRDGRLDLSLTEHPKSGDGWKSFVDTPSNLYPHFSA